MGLNQWNNHQQMRDHMENEYQEQQYRGDDPNKARDYYNSKARIGFWLALLVILLVALTWAMGRTV